VIAGMASLIDKSLIGSAAVHSPEPRYFMLETIREYGLEHLQSIGEAGDAHRQHAAYFLALAEASARYLETADQAVWLDRLELDKDNLRAALRWAVTNGEAEQGLRLGGALWLFWFIRGELGEGREWLEDLLALAGEGADRAARARALLGAATLARYQGDYAAAGSLAHEALNLERELGNRRGVADTMATLGYVALFEGQFE